MTAPETREQQDLYIQNFLKNFGNIEKACRETPTKKGGHLSSGTVRQWRRTDKGFVRRLNRAREDWHTSLYQTAYEEATGAWKQAIYDRHGELKGYKQNRPVPLLLIFLLKSIRPEIYDEQIRLQSAKLDARGQEIKKFPLPIVRFESAPVPERIASSTDPRQVVPESHLVPPPRTKAPDAIPKDS